MTDGQGNNSNGAPGSRTRVLVIDDDDALCEMLRQSLGDQGFAVATVPHGAAALELLKHHNPAVILVDLRMPIMDGWAFVEQYRRQAQPQASIILLTAARDIEENATRLRADGFVRKPFELDEVTAAIGRCIAKRLREPDQAAEPPSSTPGETPAVSPLTTSGTPQDRAAGRGTPPRA